ncbi:MAG: DUF3037 domain-containing protein [Bacteroides sp.]|nr:DUF3037 domain-containing protein [Bacteroides sp.]
MSEENHLYEYAVIRYLPAPEREEFINIGLIMMCKRRRWLRAAIAINEDRIRPFRSELPLEALRRQAQSMVDIAHGLPHSGTIGLLPPEERFRWLSAVKSTCLQTSRPHPGLTTDLDTTFQTLLAEQVL